MNETSAAFRPGDAASGASLGRALDGVVPGQQLVLHDPSARAGCSGLPRAVLSAIVVNAVWKLMDFSALRRYARVRRNDIVAELGED